MVTSLNITPKQLFICSIYFLSITGKAPKELALSSHNLYWNMNWHMPICEIKKIQTLAEKNVNRFGK